MDEGRRLVMSLNLEKVCDIEVSARREKNPDSSSPRAHSAADSRAQTVDEEQLVSFELSGEEYALNIQSVREIIRIPELVRTPNAPDYVMGVISLRKHLLPLVDLRQLFGLPPRDDEMHETIDALQMQMQEHEEWQTILEELVELGENQLDLPEFTTTRWCKHFRTDQELLRLEVEKIGQSAAELQRLTEQLRKLSADQRPAFLQERIIPLSTRVRDLFREGVQIVEKNDEQRIVVTESNGLAVGMMVDRVREVMRIPKNLIDPPPRLTAHNGPQAERGVAKLDNGQRLVMILDNHNLFDASDLEQIGDGATVDALEATDNVEQVEQTAISLRQQGLEEEQLVTFLLGREEFGIRIMQIQEINRLGEVTKVPRAPFYVDGVSNLRGVVVPVINLRTRFRMEPQEVNDRTRIVIVDLDGKKTALIVDQVSEVMRLPKRDITPPPSVVSAGGVNDYMEGIGRLDNGKRMVMLLDVNRILEEEGRQGLQSVLKSQEAAQAEHATPARKQLRTAPEE